MLFLWEEPMNWIILIIAGLFETFWSYELKLSEGFSKLLPSILTIGGMVVSFGLLAHALKTLPLSVGYAVWTDIGIVGAAILGIVLLKEPVSAAKVLCIGLIVVGIVGLNLTSGD